MFIKEAKSERAQVFRAQQRVGIIQRTPSGSVFQYDSNFLDSLESGSNLKENGVAYHLPYSKKRHETSGVNLHPYFAGLLPEGLRLRAILQKLKTSEDDLLSILIAIGSDCIGDLSTYPEGVEPFSHQPLADLGKMNELAFDELFEKSISIQPDPLVIPGVQDKISSSMISFPIRGSRDFHSYILKLQPADKPRIIQNEYFFLKMARACGLEVNEAKIVSDKNQSEGLLIQRFDRVIDKGSTEVQSVHQEDACQFLNRYPADKYRIAFSEIAEAFQLCSAPIVERGKLIRLKAFSYLIGNGDLHAKNISLHTCQKTGRIQMTPAYDLLSTLPYGDQKMALKLDGRDDNLTRRSFLEFGKRFEIRERATSDILEEIYEVAPSWIKRLEEIGLSEKQTTFLRNTMNKRLKDLRGD